MLKPKPLASRQGAATRSELLRKIGPGAIDQTASKGASCPTSWKAGPALSERHRQGHDNRCPAHALATGEPASIAASPATLRRSLAFSCAHSANRTREHSSSVRSTQTANSIVRLLQGLSWSFLGLRRRLVGIRYDGPCGKRIAEARQQPTHWLRRTLC